MKRWISSEVEDRTTDQRQWSHDPEAAKALVLTFALPHRQQAVLVAVAERPLRHRLKVPRVHPPAGDRVAALAHAGVVAQTPFVQVRVGQRVAAGDPLGLDSETRRHYARKNVSKDATSNANSPDRRPACGKADAPPRAWRHQTACRALTVTAEKNYQSPLEFVT